jgi:uncharacterized membrane protein
MLDQTHIKGIIETVVLGIEAIGIVTIVGGGIIVAGQYFLKHSDESAYVALRRGLGRAILLGLEILVAADIIHTVAVEPSYNSLGVLALIVMIRTFLSFSLEVEISGRWPWQGSRWQDRAHQG